MLKKIPYITIVLTLLAWMVFWDIKETLNGERVFFLYRWIYYNMGHAKDIEVLTYQLTDEQVAHMLSRPDEDVIQPSTRELSGKNVNVVFRLRNKTGGIAYGRLSWLLQGWKWSVVDVHFIPTPSEFRKYGDIIISMGIVVGERGDDSLPDPVEVKWDTLYVYR